MQLTTVSPSQRILQNAKAFIDTTWKVMGRPVPLHEETSDSATSAVIDTYRYEGSLTYQDSLTTACDKFNYSMVKNIRFGDDTPQYAGKIHTELKPEDRQLNATVIVLSAGAVCNEYELPKSTQDHGLIRDLQRALSAAWHNRPLGEKPDLDWEKAATCVLRAIKAAIADKRSKEKVCDEDLFMTLCSTAFQFLVEEGSFGGENHFYRNITFEQLIGDTQHMKDNIVLLVTSALNALTEIACDKQRLSALHI